MQICEVNKSMLGRSIADAQPPCCYPSRLDQFSITEKDAGHCNQRAKDEFAAADFFKSHRVSQQSRRHQTGQIFRLFTSGGSIQSRLGNPPAVMARNKLFPKRTLERASSPVNCTLTLIKSS